jgi:hypothetical protein
MASTARRGGRGPANGDPPAEPERGDDALDAARDDEAPDDTEYAAALVRAELAPGELWARVALIVGLCAGCGLLASGIYDYTHVGRPKGLAANVSLGVGIALVPTTLALLLPLRSKSRDRRRLIELYGLPGAPGSPRSPGSPGSPRSRNDAEQLLALHGRRAGWMSLSVLALFLALIFFAGGLGQAFSSDPYEEPDPTVYGALLLWAAILTPAGCAGIAKARRHRPSTHTGGPYGRGTGRTTRGPHPPTPTSPRAALYARLGGRPAAPHRLSASLDARIQRLSRPTAVALATTATLLGCALGGATVLVPRYLGGGRPLFWVLLALLACYLLALLLELTHYGPRRRYLLLVLFAGIALFPTAGSGYTTSVLLERGEWANVMVEEVHHRAKGGPTCDLRPVSARFEDDDMSIACLDSEEGDALRVVADPQGEVSPRRSRPAGMTGFFLAWGGASAVLLSSAVGAALYGHRRRTELELNTMEGDH